MIATEQGVVKVWAIKRLTGGQQWDAVGDARLEM